MGKRRKEEPATAAGAPEREIEAMKATLARMGFQVTINAVDLLVAIRALEAVTVGAGLVDAAAYVAARATIERTIYAELLRAAEERAATAKGPQLAVPNGPRLLRPGH